MLCTCSFDMQYGMKKTECTDKIFLSVNFVGGDICVKMWHVHVQCVVT